MNPTAPDWKVALPVGLLAGAAGALLFLSGLKGQPSGTLFLLAAPLALFLAGLGWGLPALVVAVAAGTGLLAGIGGAGPAVIFVVFTASAPLLVSHAVAAAMRDAPRQAPPSADPRRILIALAVLGGAILVAALAAAEAAGGFRAVVEQALHIADADIAAAQRELAAKGVKMDRAQMADLLSRALPPAFTAGWLILSVGNAMLAEEILVRSKRVPRAAPHYSALTLPRATAFALAAAIGLCFAPGWAGYAGLGLTALLAAVYFFLGLAVFHAMSRRLPARPFALAVLYLCVVLFAWPALILALLGLVDQWADLRGRARRHEQEMK